MPVVPFIPLIAQGAGAVGAGIAAKKAQSSAQKRSPEEEAALKGATGAAGTALQQGTELSKLSLPYLKQAGGYYSTLLGGNRAAMSQAVAAPRAALTDVYRGAERNLERSNVQGAARDVGMAQLARDRAGKVAGLTTGVQPYAADALAGLGERFAGAGLAGADVGGRIYGNLLGEGFRNRTYARREGEDAGETWGKFLHDAILNIPTGSGNRPNSTLPSRRTTPMYGGLPAGLPGMA